MKNSIRNMILSLLAITMFSAVVVGAVFQSTKGQIALNKEKVANEAMNKVLPKYDNSLSESLEVVDIDGGQVKIYTAKRGDMVVGYAVETFTAGYGGTIKLMVGFRDDFEIYKIETLEHKETAGLGDKIENKKSNFNKQFLGEMGDSKNIELKKNGGNVDALSGATISSAAYVVGVKRAYQALKQVK